MLIDSIKLPAGATIDNATISSGSSLPVTSVAGTLFFKTGTDAGLYYYTGSEWEMAANGVSLDVTYVNANGDTMTGPLTLSGAPSANLHAASKSYVDSTVASVVNGLDYKPSVYRASSTPINLAIGNVEYIDGIQIPQNSGGRILLLGQTNPAENGIWRENQGGWARPADFVTGEVTPGAYAFVETGSLAGTGWALSTSGAITVGTTGLSFIQITSTAYTLPTASTTVLGGVKVDGTSVTISNGVISASGSASVPYDLAFSVFGKPTASENIFRMTSARAFTIPANFAASLAKASVAATAQTVFAISKNGAQVATITFAASGTTGTFSTQGAVSFAIGDKISVSAPGSADATLADIDFTFVATLA